MGHGAYDPMRVEISISSMPAGATIYRKDDNSEIGKTPLTVAPYTIPQLSGNVAWELVAKADGFEDYPISIVPKMTTSPTMNIMLIPSDLGGGVPGAKDGKEPPKPPEDIKKDDKEAKEDKEVKEDKGNKDAKETAKPEKAPDPKPDTTKKTTDSGKKTTDSSKKTSGSSKKTSNSNKKSNNKGKLQSYDIDSMIGK